MPWWVIDFHAATRPPRDRHAILPRMSPPAPPGQSGAIERGGSPAPAQTRPPNLGHPTHACHPLIPLPSYLLPRKRVCVPSLSLTCWFSLVVPPPCPARDWSGIARGRQGGGTGAGGPGGSAGPRAFTRAVGNVRPRFGLAPLGGATVAGQGLAWGIGKRLVGVGVVGVVGVVGAVSASGLAQPAHGTKTTTKRKTICMPMKRRGGVGIRTREAGSLAPDIGGLGA